MERIVQTFKNLINFKKRTRTVRFMFPAFISITALLGAAVVTSSNVSYVRLEASDSTIEAEKTFYLDVYAYAHVPVNAVDITVEFDSEVVEVTGVDTGQSVLTIWTQEPVVESNKVLLQGGTFRKGFVNEHKIATINLKAKQTGQSDFKATDVILLAGDGQGTPVAVAEALDSKINLFIYDENTAPEEIGVNVELNIITDLDGNGEITLADISMFMSAWGDKSKIYDFNSDGRMTFRDFSIILANFFF